MPGVLVDTNILVYAYVSDPSDARVGRAKKVLEKLAGAEQGFTGVQNLAEFSSVCLTRVRPPVEPARIRRVVEDLESILQILSSSSATVRGGLRAVEEHGFSFWDAMIWSLAKENGVEEVLTEDFQHGREVEGVRFRNPFR